MVITRSRLTAFRALAPALGVGLEGDLNVLMLTVAAEPDLLVNKACKTLNPVQNGLNFELDSWSFGRGFVFLFQLTNYSKKRDQLSVCWPPPTRQFSNAIP